MHFRLYINADNWATCARRVYVIYIRNNWNDLHQDVILLTVFNIYAHNIYELSVVLSTTEDTHLHNMVSYNEFHRVKLILENAISNVQNATT